MDTKLAKSKVRFSSGQISWFLALFSGVVIALSFMNLGSQLNSPSSPTYAFDRWDFHPADLFCVVLLLMAWQLKALARIQPAIMAVSGILILSTLWSTNPDLTLYRAIRLSLVLCTFSFMREHIVSNWKVFLAPLMVLVIVSIPIGVWQAWNGDQVSGLTGQKNPLAGLSVFLILVSPLSLIFFPAAMLALSASRAGLLALAVCLPFLGMFRGWKQAFGVLAICAGLFAVALPLSGFSDRLAPEQIGLVNDDYRYTNYLPEAWHQITGGGKDTFLGRGFATQLGGDPSGQPGLRYDNPHNIYLILLESLGWVFGVGVILLLVFRRLSVALLAFLVIGFFDHYPISIAQGSYLFAVLLAVAPFPYFYTFKDRALEKIVVLSRIKQQVREIKEKTKVDIKKGAMA